jgi:NADH-quinone oxidoreductase subunit E
VSAPGAAAARGDGGAPVLSERFLEDARAVIARYPPGRERSALMPLLYLVQAEHGHVSREGIAAVAALLGLTRAEVAAVATFYTMFKREPQGRWLLSVCTQPSCALAGALEVKERLERECGVGCGETTPDGLITLEEVECLCACDGAPVVSINYENYERLGPEEWAGIVRTLRAGGAPPPGARGVTPEDFRTTSRRMAGLGGP